MTEAELEKQTGLVSELTRKVDELQVTADLAAHLKDQVDEYATLTCPGVSGSQSSDIAMQQTSSRRLKT